MSSDLYEIILLTFLVSGTALLLSTLIGVPLGAVMGLRRFIGRRWVVYYSIRAWASHRW